MTSCCVNSRRNLEWGPILFHSRWYLRDGLIIVSCSSTTSHLLLWKCSMMASLLVWTEPLFQLNFSGAGFEQTDRPWIYFLETMEQSAVVPHDE